jgi:cysteine-rich repeat protein
MNSGDGCSANCQSLETCGNSITDVGEECDNGPTATPGCDPDCTDVMCGDGTRNGPAGEACDDGNFTDSDGCVGCQVARCGDNHTRTSGPAGTIEQCDDGGNGNNDFCLDSCVFNVCHDGYWNPSAEGCDDGNFSDSDDCVDNCVPARCGDGHVWNGVESCDDGNTGNGDGCDANCQIEVMQMPMTYVISDPTMLVNQDCDCSDGTNRYDCCNMVSAGFSWQDMTPYSPSQVVVEFNRGIECSTGVQTKNTYINGGYTGTFSLADEPGGCNCFPPEAVYGWSMSPGSYSVGGINTFTLDAFDNCFGFSYDEGIGGYARVTVYP